MERNSLNLWYETTRSKLNGMGGIEGRGGARNDRKGMREANLNSCHNRSTYKAILLELVRATQL